MCSPHNASHIPFLFPDLLVVLPQAVCAAFFCTRMTLLCQSQSTQNSAASPNSRAPIILCQLQISLSSSSLSTTLTVSNTDAKPFCFAAALHSYFRVRPPLPSQHNCEEARRPIQVFVMYNLHEPCRSKHYTTLGFVGLHVSSTSTARPPSLRCAVLCFRLQLPMSK